MKQWFKSIWMRLRKSNGLPGNEVLVPITPPLPEIKMGELALKQPKAKSIVVRKKKNVDNT